MSRRGADRIDAEIAERARSYSAFDSYEGKPDYEPVVDIRAGQPVPIKSNVSRTSLELAARQLGPSFVFNLYVHPIRLLQARNVVWQIVAQVKTNPFAPHINIVKCEDLDEGEWCLEANDKRVGSGSV